MNIPHHILEKTTNCMCLYKHVPQEVSDTKSPLLKVYIQAPFEASLLLNS